MSTPERQQDPGEHGYGGTKQDYPTDGERDPQERPRPEEVERIHGSRPDEGTEDEGER